MGTGFHQVATVSFQGMVIAFARVDAPSTGWSAASPSVQTDISYNVLSLDVDSVSDALDWDGWRRLVLPNEVRPSGMQLINVPAEYSRTDRLADLADAGAPFRVFTNQEYVYLLRQAVGGTLLVNRLRLVRQVAPDNSQEVEYVLEPAWEVRFQRSGKPDVPRDDRDVQGYLAPDREPFIEPTLELPIAGVVDGCFDSALLPRSDGPLLTCALAVRSGDDRIVMYELPLDEAGRFLLDGRDLDDEGRLAADFSFGIESRLLGGLTLQGRPALCYFLKQERVAAPAAASGTDRADGEGSFLVKRAGRLLVALQVVHHTTTLATVELAATADGTLARPAETLMADPVGVAPYTLDLAAGAYVTLPEITITGGFGFGMWLYPRSKAGPQLVVGNPGDATAPRLSLVEGDLMEARFVSSDDGFVTARTRVPAVEQRAWSRVEVDFDPGQDKGQRFTFRVNGDVLPHDEAGPGTTPRGTPITSLGAATAGFIGTVDTLTIYDAAGFAPDHLVGEWLLDTVLYADTHGAPLDPPQTPNEKDPGQPGLVLGAHLLPSTSPAATGSGGALTFDDRGLSIVTAYFDDLSAYGELSSSPALLSSADGYLHCYFRGRDDRFCVMQRDVEAGRAAFQATWTTAAGTPETGPVDFVAAPAGAFMNGAVITIADPAGGLGTAFCDVTLAAPSGRTETWRGLPRSLMPFAITLNGEAVADPSDPRLVTGAATYYDASGQRPAAYLELAGNVEAALAGFVTRQSELPLASVQVTAAADEAVDLTLTHHVPRWPGVALVQTWPAAPARVAELLRVLDGASTTYPYRSKTPANIPSYTIGAESGVMDADTVVFFTRPTVSKVDRIVVGDAPDPNLCTVEVALTEDGHPLSATWTDVPRRQELFTTTVEGTNAKYDYPNLAHGDYKAVGEALVLTTNGNAAHVDDVSRVSDGDGGLPADDDVRVYGSLFEAMVTAPVTAGDKLPATPDGPVTALAFQAATYVVDDGDAQPITGGSTLFRAQPAAVPGQGSVGLVGNTTDFTDGTAILVRQGITGGWRNTPAQRTLSFEPGGCVELETSESAAPDIGALTIQGDLSLELWCRPQGSKRQGLYPNQRLLTFARTPSPPGSGDPVRYMAGLRDCPSLKTGPDTTIDSGLVTDSGTCLAWFSPVATSGGVGPGVIMLLGCSGGRFIDPTIEIRVVDGRLQAWFPIDSAPPPIIWDRPLVVDEWHQVALPWKVDRSFVDGRFRYDLTFGLYVDGALVGSQQWSFETSANVQWARMSVGTPYYRGTLPMLVNEVAFFARDLEPAEIRRYAQQRIPGNAADLGWKWMLQEGAGDQAVNSAASGPVDHTVGIKSGQWEGFGLYARPTMGHGDVFAVLDGEPIVPGWAHLALVHQAGYALDLRGGDAATCGRGPTTELGDTFAIESWVELAPLTGPSAAMTVLAKGDDYELGVDASRQPTFSVQVRIGSSVQTLELRGDDPLAPGAARYLAATYELVTLSVDDKVCFEVHTALWVDGRVVATGVKDGSNYRQYSDAVERVSSRSDLDLGRSPLHGGSRYLQGFLSDTRLWSRALGADEIVEAYASRRVPPDRDGLVSWWRFDEGGGRIAFDVQGNNDARLSRGDIRVGYQPTSVNRFYVDGREATPTWLSGVSSIGGFPEGDAFQFASSAADRTGFRGQLDGIRIWSTQLTGEQIADSMQRTLSGGERHLAGLWNLDSGSGPVVEDATGRGNVGRLAGNPVPTWAVSTAPLGTEAEGVLDILGGVPRPTHDDVTDTPSVVEYADLQRDAYGGLFSVMKRAYVSVDDGLCNLVTGYKVGDLETVYLGQAQSKPSLIGFVEGAPPIPSENQTLPYWTQGGFSLNTYAGASSVTFEEADDTTYIYSASRDVTVGHDFNVKGGFYASDEVDMGLGVEKQMLKYEAHAAPKTGAELTDQGKEGVDRRTGSAVSMVSSLRPGGAWEDGEEPAEWANPAVGRRYIPDNTGMALVKSRTVDVYASILASTRSMVKVTYTPNPDIPEDVNILTFPIDPQYVKNGTLDGKVGLEKDPSYRDADPQRASYFKPIEAYALKRRIERDQARQASYYAQYDVARYAARLRNESSWADHRQAQRANDAYDWATHLAKRNIVNTYVWTAAGGSYAEQTSTMDVYTESHGAVSSRTARAGVVGDLTMSIAGPGFYLDFDYLHSGTTSVDVVRSQESTSAFALRAEVTPDPWLYAPRIDGTKVTFPAQPTEGKVDGYRYLAFCLAPATDNFDDFRNLVVDRHWLDESMDSAAVALREATVATNGAWRVLYRVTYVSRIPPRFQPVPDETRAPDVAAPVNPEFNTLLVELVDRALHGPDPTEVSPVDIGAAIATVIGTPTEPGPLADLLPWWPQFLQDTGNYLLPAAGILRTLREDLLRYMIETYAYRAARQHG